MIVRLLLWRLDEADASFEDLREGMVGLGPLPPPSTWLVNEPGERVGALLMGDDDDASAPPQLDGLRALVGREPDLYEEFDAG